MQFSVVTVKMILIAVNLNSWERTVISLTWLLERRGSNNWRFPNNYDNIFTFTLLNLFKTVCLCFTPFWFVVKQLESDATRDDMWTVRFSFSLAWGIKWCSRMTMTIMTMIAHIMGVGVVGVKIGQSELCSCFPPKSFVMVHHESWYHEIICRCTQMLRCVKSRKAAILCLRTEAQAGGQALQVKVMMLVMVIRKCYL